MNDKLNSCIIYIYNEMDPSEQVEFKRELKKDENLLIEVESLRKTSEKLQGLELIEPPSDLVEEIRQKAADFKTPRQTSVNWLKWSSVAAVIMISVSVSSYMLLFPATEDSAIPENSGPENVFTGSASQQWSIETETDEESGSISNNNNISVSQQHTAPPAQEEGTPWVNKNDIIRFNGLIQTATASQLDSIKTQSLKKLTPVERSQERARAQHRLHLTGSNQ